MGCEMSMRPRTFALSIRPISDIEPKVKGENQGLSSAAAAWHARRTLQFARTEPHLRAPHWEAGGSPSRSQQQAVE